MKKSVSVLLAMLFLCGCGVAGMMNTDPKPTGQQLMAADYGPLPENHQEQIKSYWQRNLLNPVGAIVEAGPLHKTWAYAPKNPNEQFNISGKRVVYGYGACGFLNAQNRMGGYTGRQIFYAVFLNGQIAGINDIPTQAWEKCNGDLTPR